MILNVGNDQDLKELNKCTSKLFYSLRKNQDSKIKELDNKSMEQIDNLTLMEIKGIYNYLFEWFFKCVCEENGRFSIPLHWIIKLFNKTNCLELSATCLGDIFVVQEIDITSFSNIKGLTKWLLEVQTITKSPEILQDFVKSTSKILTQVLH